MKIKDALLILVMIIIGSCATQTEINRGIDVESTVKRIVQSYQNRDVETIMRSVSRDYLGGYNEFEKRLREDLNRIDQIEIRYTLDSIDDSGKDIRVGIRWRKKYLERSDRDFDGMPDIWERYNGLDESNPADAYDDNDGDGFTNRQEYIGNSNPMDAGSVPAGTVNTIPSSSKRDIPGSSYLIFIKEEGEYHLIAQQEDILFGNSDKQEDGF